MEAALNELAFVGLLVLEWFFIAVVLTAFLTWGRKR